MGSTLCAVTRLSSPATFSQPSWLPPLPSPQPPAVLKGRPGRGGWAGAPSSARPVPREWWGASADQQGPSVSEAPLPQGWPPAVLMPQPDSTFCKNRVVVLMSPPHPPGPQPLLLQGRSLG